MKPSSSSSKQTVFLSFTCLVLIVALLAAIIGFMSALDNSASQIASLQNLAETQQSELSSLRQQLDSLKNTDVANLTVRLAEKDAQIANLSSQNAALKSEVLQLQNQLAQNDTTELTIQEKIRDSVMDYIKFNHPETAQFMSGLEWTGGRITPGTIVGAETYEFASSGWEITMHYPVVANPLYNVTADYSAPFTGIPYRIIWTGSWQNWQMKENSYVFAQ